MRDKIIVVAIKNRRKPRQQRPAMMGNAILKESHRIIKDKREEKNYDGRFGRATTMGTA
jgi:hypothetical protein